MRRAYNTPIQGTGACMTKLALVYLRRYIKKNNLKDKVKLIHAVHDACMSETVDTFAKEWSLIQEKCMKEAGEVFIKSVPIKSDTTISKYWTK